MLLPENRTTGDCHDQCVRISGTYTALTDTTIRLEEALEFWTVGRREDDSHKYLIIAREVTTLVLELGSDMVELEAPLFITSETTVAAGELATGSLAVQVLLPTRTLKA